MPLGSLLAAPCNCSHDPACNPRRRANVAQNVQLGNGLESRGMGLCHGDFARGHKRELVVDCEERLRRRLVENNPLDTQAGISDNTIMMAILARDQQIAWVYVPIMMMLAFGFGFCIGKHVPGWTAENHSRQHNVAQNSRDTTSPNAAEVPDDDIDQGNSEAHETRNMTADNHHDILRFGKFQLPDPTTASGILKEMSAITFTDGKYRDQTFAEVWNIDRFKSCKRWLQQRLHQIDIGYSAYVVYAELKELAQR